MCTPSTSEIGLWSGVGEHKFPSTYPKASTRPQRHILEPSPRWGSSHSNVSRLPSCRHCQSDGLLSWVCLCLDRSSPGRGPLGFTPDTRKQEARTPDTPGLEDTEGHSELRLSPPIPVGHLPQTPSGPGDPYTAFFQVMGKEGTSTRFA
jgi:hypothetical protein